MASRSYALRPPPELDENESVGRLPSISPVWGACAQNMLVKKTFKNTQSMVGRCNHSDQLGCNTGASTFAQPTKTLWRGWMKSWERSSMWLGIGKCACININTRQSFPCPGEQPARHINWMDKERWNLSGVWISMFLIYQSVLHKSFDKQIISCWC